MWQQLLKNKYLGDKSLTQISRRSGDSHFWSGLMNIKDQFLRLGDFQVGDGQNTRFWQDKWLTSRPFCEQFPNLFNTVRIKSALVAEVCLDTNLNLSFRRTITGSKLVEWKKLLHLLTTVRFSPARDKFVWDGHKNGIFSVQSMYHLLMYNPNNNRNKMIWKLKIPLKIKVFLWNLGRGVILTKDNLAKKRWKGIMTCCFCNRNESIHHLFFDCYIAKNIWRIIYLALKIEMPVNINHIIGSWASNCGLVYKKLLFTGISALFWSIWLTRNEVAFNQKPIPSIVQVIFRGTHWFRFWRLLQREDVHQQIIDMCQALEMVAMKIFAFHGWRSNARLECA
jgi:hypothetical protein